MINKLRSIYKTIYLNRLIKHGLNVGENFDMEKGVNIDANFPWLIEIGNNVVLSPWVYILSHDSASKKYTGLMKVGKVKIGDNVFIGAKSTVLPGVTIGSGSIIGTNSVVTSDIPENSVAVGIPAKVIASIDEYKTKQLKDIQNYPRYTRKYTLWGKIKNLQKKQMQDEMIDNIAYINADEY